MVLEVERDQNDVIKHFKNDKLVKIRTVVMNGLKSRKWLERSHKTFQELNTIEDIRSNFPDFFK